MASLSSAEGEQRGEESKPVHPRVFMSYSHDSETHSDRVLDFTYALRNNGIDADLDQFHTEEILDWPRWCRQKISRKFSDFVICVCTREYFDRVEGDVPPERGKGAYLEGSQLDDELYNEKGNRRIIPVLLNDEPEKSILLFLGGWTFCHIREFTLNDPGFEQLVRILTGKASVEKNVLGEIPPLPPRRTAGAQVQQPQNVVVSTTRLRHGADVLFGREKELADLDAAWEDPETHVVTLVAWGGVGKTSLVVDWMARMSKAGWRGTERVFDWSFYSQGTREQGEASADAFVAEALKFFGDPEMAASPAPAWDKGARLARLVAQRRTLLVLDGLEPLQHPPGAMSGKLKDPAVEALLRGLAQNNPGLCIVTTREHVVNLAPFNDKTAPEWHLEHLSEEAGAQVLKQAKVDGSDDELREASREVNGHALTLSLLGRYLARAHKGDIRKRALVNFTEADARIQGGHAFKVMLAYEKWFTKGGADGQRQLAILRLMGFFDRPADPACLAVLCEPPVIRGLNGPITELSETDWNMAVAALVEAGLVQTSPYEPKRIKGYGKDAEAKSLRGKTLGEPKNFDPPRPRGFRGEVLDAHPLVRQHFAGQLRKTKASAWKEGHRRLYEHLKASVPYWPEGADGLQPLYQAVSHGCQAGLHEDACAGVYRDRIMRTYAFYSAKKLGLIGADLGAVACFFYKPWVRLAPTLSERAQAWLLNEAAFRLQALGRLNEALEPMRASLEMAEGSKAWEAAAIRASNLSGLELTLGDVFAAVHDAERSVEFADRSKDEFQRMTKRATLADALHQAGRVAEARDRFTEAETMLAKQQPESPLLYSLAGFRYCDLLLSEAECAAWLRFIAPDIVERPQQEACARFASQCREVGQRAAQTLRRAEERGLGLLTPALDHLTLGRAAVYRAVLDVEGPGRAAALQSAREHLDEAVDGLRRASAQDFLPRGLLSRAWLRHIVDDDIAARADLDEAWGVAERGPMRLHMADILLYRARLFHDKAALEGARTLIEKHGYHRRDAELEDAARAARGWQWAITGIRRNVEDRGL